jgi:hypothetical protein
MHSLFPLLLHELANLAREFVKWTFVGVLFFIGMWFLTDGLPRLVAVINGPQPVPVMHSTTSQLAPPRHPTSLRGDL